MPNTVTSTPVPSLPDFFEEWHVTPESLCWQDPRCASFCLLPVIGGPVKILIPPLCYCSIILREFPYLVVKESKPVPQNNWLSRTTEPDVLVRIRAVAPEELSQFAAFGQRAATFPKSSSRLLCSMVYSSPFPKTYWLVIQVFCIRSLRDDNRENPDCA